MAQCSEVNRLNVTLRDDIKVRNFSDGEQASSSTFTHNGSEPLFTVEVYPRGRAADNEDYLSVVVNRCWFYPHFIPGVVYSSLGWTVSVVDVVGRERFHAYFGNDEFLTLAWAEDFFGDHSFGLEKFVKRSALLDDREEFLPDDVLTVRCEVFYECHTGDAAMHVRGEVINAFLVKCFATEMAAKRSFVDECGNVRDTNDEPSVSTKFPRSTGPSISNDPRHLQKAMDVMNESFDELKGAFELYAKLQQLKDISEQNPQAASSGQQDKDFSQDIETAAGVFLSLHEKAIVGEGNEPDLPPESNVPWWDESNGVAKVTHQLVRMLALHKHLQVHLEKCRTCYKEAAEKMRAERNAERPNDTMEEEIVEMFSIYDKLSETFSSEAGDQKTRQDCLLSCISRFLTVFLNILRVLTLRMYFPVCVLEQPPSSAANPDVDTTQKLAKDDDVESTETVQEVHKENSSNQKLDVNESPSLLPISNSVANPEGSVGEKWYFTIETADGKTLDVPFQEGQTTLGSLLRAACPVFDRMLDTPMLEKTQRRLKLDDIDHSTLCNFTSYIQTGEVSTETLDDSGLLYRMAHKYQMRSLMLACAERMARLMDHLNAEDIAQFSKFFEDDTLMSLVEGFRFRPRATMAVLGLQELSPLSTETTWSQAIADLSVVEKATEAIFPKDDYDFYN